MESTDNTHRTGSLYLDAPSITFDDKLVDSGRRRGTLDQAVRYVGFGTTYNATHSKIMFM